MAQTSNEQANVFATKLLDLRWLSKKHLTEELSVFDLTPSQYVTLHAMEDKPAGVKMSELAKQAHQVSATMTGIIDRLESQGLVSRFRVEQDRRNVYVNLTESGRFLLNTIVKAKIAKIKDILDQLSEEQKEMLFSAMDVATTYFTENLRGSK